LTVAWELSTVHGKRTAKNLELRTFNFEPTTHN